MANAKVELLFERYPWLRSIELADKAIRYEVRTFNTHTLTEPERMGRVVDRGSSQDVRGYLVGEGGISLGNIHDNVQGIKGWLRYLASCLLLIDDVSQTRTVLEAARAHLHADQIRFVVILRQMHHLREYISIEVFKLPPEKIMSDFLPPRWPRVCTEARGEVKKSKSQLESMLAD